MSPSHGLQGVLRHLIPGVRIFLSPGEAKADRIQLSTGTTQAPSAVGGWSYRKGAVIPQGRWRGLTAEESAILLARTRPKDHGMGISVVGIPHPLLAYFRNLREAVSDSRTGEALAPLLDSASCRRGTSIITEYVRRCFQRMTTGAPIEPIVGGLRVNPPGLPTVTVHPHSAVLIGLHLDSWYSCRLERREQSPNRICVNLGCQDRFLVFVNVPIARMYEAVRLRASNPPRADAGGTPIAQVFMALFPSYPVVRVKIGPGEAYIAPTENVVHDGSSSEMSIPDVVLSLRGRFELSRD